MQYVYLLRIPLLTIAGILGLCVAAFFWPPNARLLLSNGFDLTSRWGIFFVSLSAFLVASVVMVSWRLVRLYGPRRFFDDASLEISPNVRRRDPFLYSLIALPVVAGAMYKSTAFPWHWELLMGSLGFVAALICLVFVAWLRLLLTRSAYAERPPEDDVERVEDLARTSPDLFLPTEALLTGPLLDRARSLNPTGSLAERITSFIRWLLPKNWGRGYFEHDREGRVVSILPGHVVALVLLAVTILVYVVIGFWDFLRLRAGQPLLIPTLSYIMLLAMLLCWGFSSLAFFFDRYRIPVLIPLVAFLFITSRFGGADYFYPVVEPDHAIGDTAANVAAGSEAASDGTIIVVAANGGGIQAAAWTARVLTGLEEECQATRGCGDRFGESIRLISSVSGGSIGTMYFVNEYTDTGLPPEEELENIVARAEASSLDHIAWGILYPDLVRTFNPLPYTPGPLGWDRGRALEQSWLRREDQAWSSRDGIQEGLSEWQEDARAGRRPAVIFNTTVAETGERLPLATTELPPGSPGRTRFDRLFEGITPRPDIRVVTAARLSAAFPYVSPAARADVQEQQAHLVDGGYYDNYGISSLVEWLDWRLESDRDIERVLILEIRGAPSGPSYSGGANLPAASATPDRKSERGWFYQVFAPVATVLNVRDTGQRTHNEVELDLLRDKWAENDEHPVEIKRVTFEFDGADPPLSWHLTERDKRAIEENWEAESKRWRIVETFLSSEEDNQ